MASIFGQQNKCSSEEEQSGKCPPTGYEEFKKTLNKGDGIQVEYRRNEGDAVSTINAIVENPGIADYITVTDAKLASGESISENTLWGNRTLSIKKMPVQGMLSLAPTADTLHSSSINLFGSNNTASTTSNMSIASVAESIENWKTVGVETPIESVSMPSVADPSIKTIPDTKEYKTARENLELIGEKRDLFEFFNETQEEPNITKEQYDTLIPFATPEVRNIIKATRVLFANEGPSLPSYSFNRANYISLINEPNKLKRNAAENLIPKAEQGSILLSVYKKGGRESYDTYYLRTNGTIGSTKNPTSNYSFVSVNGDELLFKLNQGSSVSKGLYNMGSSVKSSFMNRFTSKSAPASGGRRTRRIPKYNKTRKEGNKPLYGGKKRKSSKK